MNVYDDMSKQDYKGRLRRPVKILDIDEAMEKLKSVQEKLDSLTQLSLEDIQQMLADLTDAGLRGLVEVDEMKRLLKELEEQVKRQHEDHSEVPEFLPEDVAELLEQMERDLMHGVEAGEDESNTEEEGIRPGGGSKVLVSMAMAAGDSSQALMRFSDEIGAGDYDGGYEPVDTTPVSNLSPEAADKLFEELFGGS